MRLRAIADGLVVAAVLITAGAVVLKLFGRAAPFPSQVESESTGATALPTLPVSLVDASVKGISTAPAVILEFSDFECSYCARFAMTTLPALVAEFVDTGKAIFAFRHLPLSKHVSAQAAAEIAACADSVGSFWKVHDAFFSKSIGETFSQTAAKAGLLADEQRKCADDSVSARRVREDLALAKSLGVRGTPTFFVGRNLGGRVAVKSVIRGAKPVSEFRMAIDAIVAEEQGRK